MNNLIYFLCKTNLSYLPLLIMAIVSIRAKILYAIALKKSS